MERETQHIFGPSSTLSISLQPYPSQLSKFLHPR